ncbi:hypothetical protein C8R44DRAFT_895094 [Mycena epipterygia]|nr:hypothetical protein C8R44DRAFT_895094 [Mycena epipterygia]
MDSDLRNSAALIEIEEQEIETCTFSTICLRSYHGYADAPVGAVDDGLGYRLPPIRSYHSRVVRSGGSQFLVWSPNSLQDPYYPGLFDLRGNVAMAADTSQHRYDGQGGPSDFTKVPQAYRVHRPWLGFIKRESRVSPDDIEYQPAYSVWENPTSSALKGRVRPQFIQFLRLRNNEYETEINFQFPRITNRRRTLTINRPQWPTPASILKLEEIEDYEDAVDRIADVQRGLREKGAWLLMVETWIAKPPPVPALTNPVIKPADDKLLGVWANSASEEDCVWFLTSAAVPCFFIHRLPRDEPLVLDAARTFAEGTEVQASLETSSNEYDHIATRRAYRFTTQEFWPVPRVTITRSEMDRTRASLRWQMDLPEGRVLPRDVPRHEPSQDERNLAIRLDMLASRSEPPATAAGARFDQRMETLVLAVGSGTRPVDASGGNPGGSRVLVHPNRVHWLRPPPVACNLGKRWTIFREGERDDSDATAMMEVGANSKEKGAKSGETVWYDRIRSRKLLFQDLPPVDEAFGLTTGEEYGRPVPDWPFLYPSGNRYLDRAPSLWMYQKEKPDPFFVGRVAKAPEARFLPGLDGAPHDTNEARWATHPGDQDGGSEDEVSLGSESEMEEHGPTVPLLASPPSPPPPASSLSRLERATPTWPRPSLPRLIIKGEDLLLLRKSATDPLRDGGDGLGLDLGEGSDRGLLPLRGCEPREQSFVVVDDPARQQLGDARALLIVVCSSPRAPRESSTNRRLRSLGLDATETRYSHVADLNLVPATRALPGVQTAEPLSMTDLAAQCSVVQTPRSPAEAPPMDVEDSISPADLSPSLLQRFSDSKAASSSTLDRFGVTLENRVGSTWRPPRLRRHNRTAKREAREREARAACGESTPPSLELRLGSAPLSLERRIAPPMLPLIERIRPPTLEERIFQEALYRDAQAQEVEEAEVVEETYKREDDFYDTDEEV